MTNELEEQIFQIQSWKKDCEDSIKILMEKEDFEKKIFFAKEIYDCVTRKNILSAHLDLRKARLNRMSFSE